MLWIQQTIQLNRKSIFTLEYQYTESGFNFSGHYCWIWQIGSFHPLNYFTGNWRQVQSVCEELTSRLQIQALTLFPEPEYCRTDSIGEKHKTWLRRALRGTVSCTLYDIFCGCLQILQCSAPLFITIMAIIWRQRVLNYSRSQKKTSSNFKEQIIGIKSKPRHESM